MINRQKTLSGESYTVDSALPEETTQVNRGYLVKSRCLTTDLRIARPSAVKRITFSANEKIAVRIDIQRSEYRTLRDIDRRLPRDSTIRRTLKFHAEAAAVSTII